MSNGRSYSSQTHAHWGYTIYEVVFELLYATSCISIVDMTESLATFR